MIDRWETSPATNGGRGGEADADVRQRLTREHAIAFVSRGIRRFGIKVLRVCVVRGTLCVYVRVSASGFLSISYACRGVVQVVG